MVALIIFEVLLFGILLTADLVSKHFAVLALPHEGDSMTVIDKVLSFTYSKNDGAGFGLFSGKQTFLIIITAIAMAALLAFLIYMQVKKETKKKGGMLFIVSTIMIIAGGVGNLVDRVAFGYVRDFIEYTVIETLFKKPFPICNVTDVWCTIGVILLIVYIIFFFGKTLKDAKNKENPQTEIASDGEESVNLENPDALPSSESSDAVEENLTTSNTDEVNFENPEESETIEKSTEEINKVNE